jgi:hypothetical protein
VKMMNRTHWQPLREAIAEAIAESSSLRCSRCSRGFSRDTESLRKLDYKFRKPTSPTADDTLRSLLHARTCFRLFAFHRHLAISLHAPATQN